MDIPSAFRRLLLITLSFCALLSFSAVAQPVDPSLYSGLRWRMIGPFRGGRSIAVSGVEGQPNLFYFGSVGGGVWKSGNAGETWEPIFDGQSIGSIGAIAIVQSNARSNTQSSSNIIYVGTGEADFRSNLSYGNGVYKSVDGGKSWNNIGLRASRHVSRIVIDPGNPQIVFVAAMGSAYGPGAERGVFRSSDGGATWQKVLYKNVDTGAADVQLDPDNPQTVYAALVYDRRPAWSTYAPTTKDGAIYKSTDGGTTWKQLSGNGLPGGEVGRIGLAVARGTGGKRVYALVDATNDKERGLYRSDDAGQTWQMTSADPRIDSRGWYFGEIVVDPRNPDVVYCPNVSIYRSTDGGRHFVAIKGAPGGDDYHALWIDPAVPTRMIFGSDQGVGVSVDNGKSWSSWYNQPTAQFYHVTVDNQFPYHVYGAQQDSGSIDTSSRGNDGSITFRDWHPTAAGESGYIAPDPTDANIIYGGSTFGELFRYDKRTGQAQIIAPEAVRTFGDPTKAEFRFSWTSPLVFSPQDSHTLYYGSQYVLRSTNQGNSWEKISPDLTGTDPQASHEGPTTVDNAMPRGYGVVYAIAPSPVAAGQIWAGTDTGLVHLTRDGGKTWSNVSPRISAYSKISILDASHFDAATAYAAADRHRLDDIGAYIYRTHDFGKTWTRINAGIPDGAYVRAVREDPVRKGLLYAGTELGVFFSTDDGDHWQPLQLNLPVTPVHDLVIKNNDLVIATHGRSFWILDDISPLRQINTEVASASAYLFKPATAMRIRANTNHDTPLSPEVPAGENPPSGAVFYYYLKTPAQGEVKLAVSRGHRKIGVRSYSSSDPTWTPPVPPAFPNYWFAPPERVSTAAGMHRLVWDLRLDPPSFQSTLKNNVDYAMSTAYGQDVPHLPQGPLVAPGDYSLTLSVGDEQYIQDVHVVMDPRVQTPQSDLQSLFESQQAISWMLILGDQALVEIAQFYASSKHTAEDIKIEQALMEIEPASLVSGRQRRGPATGKPTLSAALSDLVQIAVAMDAADAVPTETQGKAAVKAVDQVKSLLDRWKAVKPKAK
jgi:photosystem II stability/assembly factor-like uncharacterized protein